MPKMYFDGCVDITCPQCGTIIERHVPYKGFSTALCLKCQKKNQAEDAVKKKV